MATFDNVALTKKANIYFDGKVTSRSFRLTSGEEKTVGIMLPGEYTFNTALPELMEIQFGDVDVRLAGESGWKNYTDASAFNVPGNSAFDIRVNRVTDYICSFLK